MITTLNALKTHFHFVTSNENGDKRNLVSFSFTFSEYKSETKSTRNPFPWLWWVRKRNQMKLRVILCCLESVKSDPNNAFNLFSFFCNLEKDKQCLWLNSPYFSEHKKWVKSSQKKFHGLARSRKKKRFSQNNRFSWFSKHEKEQSFLKGVPFHGLTSTRKNKSLLGGVIFHGLVSTRKNKSFLGGSFFMV